MLSLSRRTVIATAMVGTAAVAVPATLAATGTSGAQPANKAVASGSYRQVFAANQTEKILSATIKTSKPEDLLLTLSMECSILTALTTNNTDPSSSAATGVRAWITIDGKVVPIQDVSTPPQDPAASGNGDAVKDGVTFCDRAYSRTVTDQEDPEDGVDEESDYIRTKSSHAFSWVRLNTGSGTHVIEVIAKFNNATTGDATAEAIVGNRTLVVEPTKLANNAVITE